MANRLQQDFTTGSVPRHPIIFSRPMFVGARKSDRVRNTVCWSVLLSTVVTSLVSLVAILTPTVLTVLFTDEPVVLALGSAHLRIMGWAYVPFALMFVLSGVMRGAGDTVPP